VQQPVRIAPSILAADFASLGEEVRAVTEAGADYIHVDVMDGHFVPNITIGPDAVGALRDKSRLPFDVHLMIAPVDPFVPRFAEAGSDLVLVMTVNPGFGGQSFIAGQLDKIRDLRARIDAIGRTIDLEVDGGINHETAKLAVEAGADVLVAGTATFAGGKTAYRENIRKLRGG
jgi:ribulose-phosphate 3-epimerase